MSATEAIAQTMRRKGIPPLLCVAVFVAILIAGLWPFRFRPRNQVTWLDGQNGIHFGRLGIAYSTDSLYGSREAIRPGRPVSVELAVRPAREVQHSLAHILTLDGGKGRQFFTLAQWKSNLILRAASQGNDLRSDFREMGATDVLSKNIPRFVTITSQNGTTKIYADGQLRKARKDFPVLPADPSATGRFVLGNSPSGTNSWTGDLLFLASYDRELPVDEVLQHFRDWFAQGTPTWTAGKSPTLLYVFDERAGTIAQNHTGHHHDISIPATFHVLRKNVLRPPWPEDYFSRSFVSDVAVNVLGFVPFGFFLLYGYERKTVRRGNPGYLSL